MDGAKNYPGIVTGLQMQLYLVIGGFKRRVNKRGQEYGMTVSVLMTPESIWGYEHVSSAYDEPPLESWQRIFDHTKAMYPKANEKAIVKLIGKSPAI